ncbi:MAG: hypothetical protein IKQ81_05705 [Clostridiales bacterium]|nr:hypothetical protein [Clostridiales bacterium]
MLIIVALLILAAIYAVPIVIGFYELLYASIPLTALVIWGLVILIQRRYVEYEIEIVNDLFTVTKIVGKKKRVDLAEFSVKDCDYIGPVTEDRYESDYKRAELKLAITEKREYPITDDTWYALVNRPDFKYLVAFPFKPEMFQVFRRYNPRNVFHYVKPAKAKENEGGM